MKQIDLSSISRFSDKVKSTIKSRGKDFRLTIEEATDLNSTINDLLVQQNELLQKIATLSLQSSSPTDIVLSGGKL